MYIPDNKLWLRRLLIIWIVVVIILALGYGLFFSPLSPLHQCTLIGCRDTLELTLSHEPPSQYTVLLTTPSGESRRATCTPGETTSASDVSVWCRTGIVTFYGFTPSELTVQVSWQGGTYRSSGKPAYESFRPNGLFCPPTCQLGKLSIELP